MNNLSSIKIFFIILFCHIVSLHSSQVILLMGSSCAGKSTLAKHLCKQLNTQNTLWNIVDFDNVEENLELLLSTTNNYLNQNSNQKFNRNLKRAYWCRHFVIESFKKSHTWSADLHIDTSIHSNQECSRIILKYMQKYQSTIK